MVRTLTLSLACIQATAHRLPELPADQCVTSHMDLDMQLAVYGRFCLPARSSARAHLFPELPADDQLLADGEGILEG